MRMMSRLLSLVTTLCLLFVCLQTIGALSVVNFHQPPTKVAMMNLQQWKPYFSSDFNIVHAGGWDFVTKCATNPKGLLVDIIMKNTNNNNYKNEELVFYAVVNLLHAQGKGFDSDLVQGDWNAVLSKQARKSPRIQKWIATNEHQRLSFANFDTNESKFQGHVKLLWGQGDLQSTVRYKVVKDNFNMIGGKVVLRRIECDIIGASWKFWKLPRVPLPLKVKGGYLDFEYLDGDLRITKGNRGGVFVHFRPKFYQEQRTLRQVAGADI